MHLRDGPLESKEALARFQSVLVARFLHHLDLVHLWITVGERQIHDAFFAFFSLPRGKLGEVDVDGCLWLGRAWIELLMSLFLDYMIIVRNNLGFLFFKFKGVFRFNVILVFLIVGHQHEFFQILEVKLAEEIIEVEIFLFNFYEELLSMRPCLGARACPYVCLHSAPLFSEEFESFKKSEVLVFTPSPWFILRRGVSLLLRVAWTREFLFAGVVGLRFRWCPVVCPAYCHVRNATGDVCLIYICIIKYLFSLIIICSLRLYSLNCWQVAIAHFATLFFIFLFLVHLFFF